MKITAVKQQVRNENRASIFVDGSYSFSLGLNELLDEKLKVGLEVDEPRLKALKKLSEEGKARMRAMEWLLVRPHSEREFQDYLRRKKIELDFGEALTKQFRERGYLNDERYAEWLIGVRASKHKSERAIRAELARKGVSGTVVARILEEDPVDEAVALEQLIIKKRRQLRYQEPDKLVAYLLRQGFSYDQVRRALDTKTTEEQD